MRRFLALIPLFAVSLCSLSLPSKALYAQGSAPDFSQINGPINVQLNEPTYIDGVMSTDKGGIITGQGLYIQAKNISYTRKTRSGALLHTIEANEQLYLVYKGKTYRGAKIHVDIVTGAIKIWDGCTRNGDWYVGGKEIEIPKEGAIVVHDAYMSTSENQRNDWSIEAQKLTIEQEKSIQAENVSFRFEKFPLFWLPSYSRKIDSGNQAAPFHYRVRWGGGLGFMLEMTYDFSSNGPWRNTGVANYSFKYGLGAGLLTDYKGENGFERFEMMNFIAQGKNHSWNPRDIRYRLQGVYKNYYEEQNVNFVAMYDKLSDSGMKDDFSDHPLTNARSGLTQATLWREEPDWIARMNGRVRINNFQTVKQELPLFTFNVRPYTLGTTNWLLDNKLSAGYLNYAYSRNTPSVKNFSSTRSELSQKLYRNYTFSPFTLTPWIGYRAIHYSSSPQHDQRLQLMGDLGASVTTRFIKYSTASFQSLEPYFTFQSIIHPSVKPGRTYIFDLEDGWARLNESKIGFRHSFLQNPSTDARLFQKKLFTDIYTRSFVGTPNLPSHPTKIWLDSVFDATSTSSYKFGFAYDFQHKVVDHFNIATRYTLSKNTAFTLEYRQRSKYAWRKLDIDNYVIDATRSVDSLLRSQMSDERRTVLASLYWTPTPNLDLELKSITGFRRSSPKRYHDMEVTVATLVRGALQLKLSYGIRSGTQHRWSISLGLGAKKESSSTGFHKIGQGNYDIW